ncbi:MAG: hypothetical protein DRN66_04185 [Candidatus Nanohalarchaeota archaeon]|nr:MAG: hypothetical protein DRN66_04185 [Candidatus Nanohaloarchaeota archaeon]
MKINPKLIKHQESIYESCICFLKNTIEAGVLFASHSLGNLADISATEKLNKIRIDVKLKNPVFACLGLQMAWETKGMLVSGPVRAMLKKPKSIFAKISTKETFDECVICIEEADVPVSKEAICELMSEYSIKNAQVLVLEKESKIAQTANILSRAIETAIFRMHFDNLNCPVDEAKSSCTADLNKIENCDDASFYLNDCLRYNAEVVLSGKIKDNILQKYTTQNSGFKSQSFGEIYKKAGSMNNMPLEAFSVKSLIGSPEPILY